jgi:hypothetical protein
MKIDPDDLTIVGNDEDGYSARERIVNCKHEEPNMIPGVRFANGKIRLELTCGNCYAHAEFNISVNTSELEWS